MRQCFLVGLLLLPLSSYAASAAITGVLKPFKSADISAELAAVVTAVDVKLGQVVNKGDALVQFSCDLFKAEAQKAEAELSAAATRLAVDEELFTLKSVGREALALNQSAVQQALANNVIANLSVDKCVVVAPFSGVVSSVQIKPYDVLQLNQPMITLVQVDRAYVEFVTDAQTSLHIASTNQVIVRHPFLETQLSAEVVMLSPVLEAVSQSRVHRAVINTLPKQWLVGMSVTVSAQPELR